MATAPKKTHFKNLFDNAYLGAYSLDTGDGHYESVDLTIASVTVEEVHGENGRTDHKPVLHFKESGPQAKAMILNATNAKRLWKALGTPYKEDWVGRKITVGVERVNSFGEKVDALRIRDKAPKQDVEQQTYVCADCGKVLTDAFGLKPFQLAHNAQERWQRILCGDCMLAQKEKDNAAAAEQAIPATDPETGEIVEEENDADTVE